MVENFLGKKNLTHTFSFTTFFLMYFLSLHLLPLPPLTIKAGITTTNIRQTPPHHHLSSQFSLLILPCSAQPFESSLSLFSKFQFYYKHNGNVFAFAGNVTRKSVIYVLVNWLMVDGDTFDWWWSMMMLMFDCEFVMMLIVLRLLV